jgi:hypothetical protein
MGDQMDFLGASPSEHIFAISISLIQRNRACRDIQPAVDSPAAAEAIPAIPAFNLSPITITETRHERVTASIMYQRARRAQHSNIRPRGITRVVTDDNRGPRSYNLNVVTTWPHVDIHVLCHRLQKMSRIAPDRFI